jgi:hypothetical protein
LKRPYREIALLYSEETIREAVSILKEEAFIEGDGAAGRYGGSTGDLAAD